MPCSVDKGYEILDTKLQNARYDFRPGRCTAGQIFALQQIAKKYWVVKMSTHVSSNSRNHMTRSLCALGSVAEIGCRPIPVAGRLIIVLLTRCVLFGVVNSQPFTVGVGLLQGCVLSHPCSS